MQFELLLAGGGMSSGRRMTSLHLMLAFTLFGLGAGCIVLYWFTSISPNFKTAFQPFLIFGICSIVFGLGIAAVSMFYKNWLMRGKRSILLRIAELGMLLTGSLLFRYAHQNKASIIFAVVAAIILLAMLWELRPPLIPKAVISQEGILVPRAQVLRKVPWEEIEQVLLRHGILSIECSGNKLIQLTLQDSPPDFAAIERFAKDCIQKHEKARVAKVDW